MMSARPWVACLAIAATYVGSIYLVGSPKPGLGKDHPWIIRRRFYAVAFTCVAAWLTFAMSMEPTGMLLEKLGLRLPGLVTACVAPLILTATLFLGSILQEYLNGELRWPWQDKSTMSFLRLFVVAPVGEEWCFRACMLPLLMDAGVAPARAILLCPLFFGAAHLHHGWEMYVLQGKALNIVVLSVGVMFTYTTVFGWYAAFLFYRTGHVASAIVAHAFCNFMGFPAFGQVLSHPHSRVVCAAYGVGIVGFSLLLRPLTAPPVYQNHLVDCWGGACER
mmetsp:Transcript_22075/g.36831  ORF Transcript_22075/g.36831 Transcript_22075/m.36831 type:complete len:278 (-) Transcript_22075:163-996(-)